MWLISQRSRKQYTCKYSPYKTLNFLLPFCRIIRLENGRGFQMNFKPYMRQTAGLEVFWTSSSSEHLHGSWCELISWAFSIFSPLVVILYISISKLLHRIYFLYYRGHGFLINYWTLECWKTVSSLMTVKCSLIQYSKVLSTNSWSNIDSLDICVSVFLQQIS